MPRSACDAATQQRLGIGLSRALKQAKRSQQNIHKLHHNLAGLASAILLCEEQTQHWKDMALASKQDTLYISSLVTALQEASQQTPAPVTSREATSSTPEQQ